MQIFFVRAEPLSGEGPAARAIVVAADPDQALVLLRKDIDFSGYRMPPAQMVPCSVSQEEVRRVLGEAAAHEIGVYGFTVSGPATSEETEAPPAALS